MESMVTLHFISDPISILIQVTKIAGLPNMSQVCRKEGGISISDDYTKQLLTNNILYLCGFVKGEWVL